MTDLDRAKWLRVAVEADSYPPHARREIAAYMRTFGDVYLSGVADGLADETHYRERAAERAEA